MALITKFQNNFTSGVLSPGVQARTDLEKYSAGCSRLVNAVVRPHGGVSKRPGTEFVDELPGGGILIPFTYSVKQTYALCFTAKESGAQETVLRIYLNGGVITSEAGEIVEIPTPYLMSELADVKFAQSADTMFLVHPAHPVQRLVRYSHDDWRFSELEFKPKVPTPANLTATPSGFSDPSGTYVADTVEYKVSAINEREQESLPTEAVEVATLSTWVQGARVSLSWDKVEGAVRYEVYKNSRGYFGWIGSAESNEFVDDNIEPDDSLGPKEYRNPFDYMRKVDIDVFNGFENGLQSYAITIGASYIGSDGTVGPCDLATKYTRDTEKALKLDTLFSQSTYNKARVFCDDKYCDILVGDPGISDVVLKVYDQSGAEAPSYGDMNRPIGYLVRVMLEFCNMGENEDISIWRNNLAVGQAYFTNTFSSTIKVDFNIKNTIGASEVNCYILTWDPSTGGAVFKGNTKYKVSIGDNHIEAVINTPGVGTYMALTQNVGWELLVRDIKKPLGETDKPLTTQPNCPGAIGVFQQRLVFGRTNIEPQTVWMSETGAFDSMAVATPLRDDSAITATVDSKQMNEIRHFLPLRDMIMFTSGAEFKISGGNNSTAVTPNHISFPIQSYWGSSNVPPIVTGTSILFVSNSNRHVRDLQYTLQEDGYSGNEVTILAEHLIDSDIVDWAYQQSPYSAVWVCLANGKLLTLTYMREQNIWAWSEHESSGGKFRSVTCIREGAEDSVYFLVEREGKFFIEHQVRRDYGDKLEDSFFVDCGLRYKGEPIKTVTGLKHLAGKRISVLADGAVLTNVLINEDGSFTLPNDASTIAAGLAYDMVLETLDPEINSNSGPVVSEKRNISRATLMLRESRSFDIGADEQHLVTLKLPQTDTWGKAPELFTGEVTTVLPGLHREKATVYMVQRDPVPCTILGICKYITVG